MSFGKKLPCVRVWYCAVKETRAAGRGGEGRGPPTYEVPFSRVQRCEPRVLCGVCGGVDFGLARRVAAGEGLRVHARPRGHLAAPLRVENALAVWGAARQQRGARGGAHGRARVHAVKNKGAGRGSERVKVGRPRRVGLPPRAARAGLHSLRGGVANVPKALVIRKQKKDVGRAAAVGAQREG